MSDRPRTRAPAPVRDLVGRAPRLPVEIRALRCAELLVEVTRYSMAGARETFDTGAEWFERVRTPASPELLLDLDQAASLAWGNLLGLALQPPVAEDVPGLLERIEATAARDLWTIQAGYHIPPLRDRVDPGTFLRAADGDRDARLALVEAERKFENDTEDFPILDMDPDRAKGLVTDILRRWDNEIFPEEREAAIAAARRDAESKVELAAQVAPEKLVELATGGLEFRPEPWISRVVLIPHVAMRPWNVLCAWEDAEIICYPVADESLGIDPAAPPGRLLRLYKALSDDRRLRILKVLARSSATLQELADAVGLAKSTTHHHMVILRSAGLVRVTTGIQSTYSLRREAVHDVSAMLGDFLGDHAT